MVELNNRTALSDSELAYTIISSIEQGEYVALWDDSGTNLKIIDIWVDNGGLNIEFGAR